MSKLFIYNLKWRDGIYCHPYTWVVTEHRLGIFRDFSYAWEEDCISSHATAGEAMDAALLLLKEQA